MPVFPFVIHSRRTLPSFGHSCVRINTNFFNILGFSCQEKSRDIVYQRTGLFPWSIFVENGLFGIILTVFSALSRLTDHDIYYITRCRIWLLTIFHIPYIHFQRELRKVTPPKLYLSFLYNYLKQQKMPKRVQMLTTKWHRKQEHFFIHPYRSFQCIRFVEKLFFLSKTMGKERGRDFRLCPLLSPQGNLTWPNLHIAHLDHVSYKIRL